MRIFYAFIFFLILLLGVIAGIKSISRSKAIYFGVENKTIIILLNSALIGLSVTLTLFGSVFFLASLLDNAYSLDISILIKSFMFFLIPGFC
jgi:hypothetical protein